MIGSSLGIIPAYAGSTSGTRPPACPCRIIPAYAGSTRRHRAWYRALRDHPRMRGEHSTTDMIVSGLTGSSPHARGARIPVMDRPQPYGIIPACAGSTPARRSTPATTRDHPRMRGEHYEQLVGGIDTLGSSPHARGALEGRHRQAPRGGIIPACAGSTRFSDRGDCLAGDHPRMRGEHGVPFSSLLMLKGSSPHARGAH